MKTIETSGDFFYTAVEILGALREIKNGKGMGGYPVSAPRRT